MAVAGHRRNGEAVDFDAAAQNGTSGALPAAKPTPYCRA
jgi:hypothetical protein